MSITNSGAMSAATAPGAVEFGVKRGRKTVNVVRVARPE